MQDALAQGLVPPSPPGALGSRRWDIGEKPVLWDTHLYPEANETRWAALMPVSAKILSEKPIGTGKRVPDDREVPRRSPYISDATIPLQRRWLPSFRSTSNPSRTPQSNTEIDSYSNNALAEGDGNNESAVENVRLQVGVMIALPSRYRPRAWDASLKGKTRSVDLDEEEEEVPDVMIGVTDVPWKVRVDELKSERPLPSS